MGVLNVTPDSFSDGGKWPTVELALERALQMAEEGADLIDIGGESSGPGSKDVSVEVECERILPVIRALRPKFKGVISVDTYKPEVAGRAIKAGADMINDIMAGRGGGGSSGVLGDGGEMEEVMFDLIAKTGAGYSLMYSKDASARTTVEARDYSDVCAEILTFLRTRMDLAERRGVKPEQVCVDPGMGAFISAKAEYSLEVLKNLRRFEALGRPILIGASRKGFIGEICGGRGPGDRLEGSLVAAAFAVCRGAKIIRTHDVSATKRAVKMALALGNL